MRQLENRAVARLGASDGTSAAHWVRAAKAVRRPETPMSREALEAWTLLLLRGRPAHGYELCQRLVEQGFHRSGPRVYRLLRELERHDLVCSEWIDGAAGPERRIYTLTIKGDHQLHADADSLQRRCETLRLFLEHYAEALDRRGSVVPTRKEIESSRPSASAPSALG
ncbi:MAG: helix-turn-helix transcriptional regulator [Actinomycetota bacterium]|nr:helix-turn-helix transcriptional regulator [Actinomycetota bacterium]